MFVVTVLKLRSALQAQSFEGFARNRWLPALYTGSTRSGDLRGARLLRRHRQFTDEAIDVENEFLLISDWEGTAFVDLPRSEDGAVMSAFEAYDIEVATIGQFESVGEMMQEGA